MAPRPFRRLATLLLTLAFVGGGFGLADLDALLYHGGRADAPRGPHYDQTGGCGAHAEHCVLGAPVSIRHAARALGSPPITTRSAEEAPPSEPARAPRPADRINLQPTRAPPAS
jgi:hypothetical protein